MNIDEYKAKKDAITSEYKEKLYLLDKEFALEHSTLKIGEFAEDHMGRILVDDIRLHVCSYRGGSVPGCVYRGVCYTKKGKPFKSLEERDVFQTNLL